MYQDSRGGTIQYDDFKALFPPPMYIAISDMTSFFSILGVSYPRVVRVVLYTSTYQQRYVDVCSLSVSQIHNPYIKLQIDKVYRMEVPKV